MKMRKEHYNYILEKFREHKDSICTHKIFLKENKEQNPEFYNDLNTRLAWDASHSLIESRWVCDDLYQYLNDSHIDTALKAALRELKII